MNYHDINIKYGTQIIDQFLPKGRGTVRVLESPPFKSQITSLKSDLEEILENPIDSPRLKDLITKHYPGSGKSVVVIADDNTRPNNHTKLLFPHLLEYLINKCGVKKSDLLILIASGTHRPPTEHEIQDRILGKTMHQEYKEQILIHNDQKNLANLGVSKRDTPITINQAALDACLLIPVTDSEYHYFAGVAGTVKQLFPGIAGRITINTNHTRMFDNTMGFTPACRLGNTDGNPVITDMIEMVEIIQQHTPVFCIDAIMDQSEITRLNAGNIITLHNLAKDILYDRRVIEVDQPADLVLVTVGELGINLYQSGKGIHAAWYAAKKPGGTVLLLAPCEDGVGSIGYQESMEAVQDMSIDQAINWVIENKCSRNTFKIGNQKPVDTLRMLKTLGENKIRILSELDQEELRRVYRLDPIPHQGSPQETLRSYFDQYLEENPEALIYVMHDAGLYVVTGG